MHASVYNSSSEALTSLTSSLQTLIQLNSFDQLVTKTCPRLLRFNRWLLYFDEWSGTVLNKERKKEPVHQKEVTTCTAVPHTVRTNRRWNAPTAYCFSLFLAEQLRGSKRQNIAVGLCVLGSLHLICTAVGTIQTFHPPAQKHPSSDVVKNLKKRFGHYSISHT